MKKLILLLFISLISFSSFGQFSNEDLDKIINERTWCMTSITDNGLKGKNDGKWFYVSGMNIINGEDNYINGIIDITNKKYTQEGISMTIIDMGSEYTLNFKIPKENYIVKIDEVNEITDLKNIYVELILSVDNSPVARLICTSLIDRFGSLPIKNWNGKNEQLAEEHLNSGIDRAEANDHIGAIAEFTKSIVLNPNKETMAYNYRGLSKEKIGDLNGACKDWKKALEFGDREASYWVTDKCN